MESVANGHAQVAELLLRSCADIAAIKDNDGNSSLDFARRCNNPASKVLLGHLRRQGVADGSRAMGRGQSQVGERRGDGDNGGLEEALRLLR